MVDRTRLYGGPDERFYGMRAPETPRMRVEEPGMGSRLANALVRAPEAVWGSLPPEARQSYSSLAHVLADLSPGAAVRDTVQSSGDMMNALLAGNPWGALSGGVNMLTAMAGAVPGAGVAERGAAKFIRGFHGTRSKPEIASGGFRSSPDGGTYFTDDPLEALKFAEMRPGGGAPKVLRADMTPQNTLVIDAGGEVFDPSMTDRAIAQAREGGHDMVILRNIVNFEHGSPTTTYIALDPSLVRLPPQGGLR